MHTQIAEVTHYDSQACETGADENLLSTASCLPDYGMLRRLISIEAWNADRKLREIEPRNAWEWSRDGPVPYVQAIWWMLKMSEPDSLIAEC